MLRYLGRYTHRIALSNRRILRVEGDQVALRYRDYADGNRIKVVALSLHVSTLRSVRWRDLRVG